MSREEQQLRAIENSLRRSFAVPDLKRVTDAVHAASAAHRSDGHGSASSDGSRWFAIAAAILLYVGAGWGLWRGVELDPSMRTDWDQLYARTVESVTVSPGACNAPGELDQLFQARLGHGLEIQPSPHVIVHGAGQTLEIQPSSEVVVHGEPQVPSVPSVPSLPSAPAVKGIEDCLLIVGQAGEDFVVCLITLREDDPRPRPRDPALKAHRSEVGPLVVYELSKLDEAVLAPLLRVR